MAANARLAHALNTICTDGIEDTSFCASVWKASSGHRAAARAWRARFLRAGGGPWAPSDCARLANSERSTCSMPCSTAGVGQAGWEVRVGAVGVEQRAGWRQPGRTASSDRCQLTRSCPARTTPNVKSTSKLSSRSRQAHSAHHSVQHLACGAPAHESIRKDLGCTRKHTQLSRENGQAGRPKRPKGRQHRQKTLAMHMWPPMQPACQPAPHLSQAVCTVQPSRRLTLLRRSRGGAAAGPASCHDSVHDQLTVLDSAVQGEVRGGNRLQCRSAAQTTGRLCRLAATLLPRPCQCLRPRAVSSCPTLATSPGSFTGNWLCRKRQSKPPSSESSTPCCITNAMKQGRCRPRGTWDSEGWLALGWLHMRLEVAEASSQALHAGALDPAASAPPYALHSTGAAGLPAAG